MADSADSGLGTPASSTGDDTVPYFPSPYPQRPGQPDPGAGGSGGTGGSGGGNGVVGKDGKSFLSLPRDPAASDGNDGDTFYNSLSTVVFSPKANGAWPATGKRLAGARIFRVATVPTDATGLAAGDIYIDDLGRLVQIQGS